MILVSSRAYFDYGALRNFPYSIKIVAISALKPTGVKTVISGMVLCLVIILKI